MGNLFVHSIVWLLFFGMGFCALGKGHARTDGDERARPVVDECAAPYDKPRSLVQRWNQLEKQAVSAQFMTEALRLMRCTTRLGELGGNESSSVFRKWAERRFYEKVSDYERARRLEGFEEIEAAGIPQEELDRDWDQFLLGALQFSVNHDVPLDFPSFVVFRLPDSIRELTHLLEIAKSGAVRLGILQLLSRVSPHLMYIFSRLKDSAKREALKLFHDPKSDREIKGGALRVLVRMDPEKAMALEKTIEDTLPVPLREDLHYFSHLNPHTPKRFQAVVDLLESHEPETRRELDPYDALEGLSKNWKKLSKEQRQRVIAIAHKIPNGVDRLAWADCREELVHLVDPVKLLQSFRRDPHLYNARPSCKVLALLQTAITDSFSSRSGPLAEIQGMGWEAEPALLRALADQNIEMRVTAAAVLNRMRILDNKGVLSALTEGRLAKNERVRIIAADALHDVDGADHLAMVPSFIQALSNKDAEVRLAATIALQELAGKENEALVPVLTGALSDKDGEVRARAAFILVRLGDVRDRTTVPPVVQALADTELLLPTRIEAALVLSNLGPRARAAVPILLHVLSDKDEELTIRKEAAFTLGRVGARDPAVVPGLIQALSDPGEAGGLHDRAADALVNLGEAGNIAVVPALIQRLSGAKGPTRQEAAVLLGRIGPEARAAAPALKRALADQDEQVGRRAAVALANVGETNPAAIRRMTEALLDKKESVSGRIDALWVLVKSGEAADAALPSLIKVLSDRDADPAIRQQVVFVLGALDKKPLSVVPALIIASSDPIEEVRSSAVGVLRSLQERALPKTNPFKITKPRLPKRLNALPEGL